MIVVKMELWPGGSEEHMRPLGTIVITNDGTGTKVSGNYKAVLSHAGKFWGVRKEPYRTCRVANFARTLSPYRLLCRVLRAAKED